MPFEQGTQGGGEGGTGLASAMGSFDLFNSMGMSDPFNGSVPTDLWQAEQVQDPYANLIPQLQLMYQQLSGPVDPNDPMYKSIMSAAQSSGGGANQAAGVTGPAAQQNVQNTVANASANYQMQRTQLAQQAMQQLVGAQANEAAFNYQKNLNNAAINNSGMNFLYQNLVPSAGNISQLLGGKLGGGPSGGQPNMPAPTGEGAGGYGTGTNALSDAYSQGAGDAAGAGGTGLFGGGASGDVAGLLAAAA